MPKNPSRPVPGPSERLLRWHVYRSRKQSDTRPEFLLEIARCVAMIPRGPDTPPLLEIGTRSGGSALLMLRVLDSIHESGERPPTVITVDPYGSRPYEGEPHIYDERHYGRMKRNLAGYTNHIHYMMDSELFLRELGNMYLWSDGTRQGFNKFSLAYLDGSHDPTIVWQEIEALLPRIIPGGFLIVDDTEWLDYAVRTRLDAVADDWGFSIRHTEKQSIITVTSPVTVPAQAGDWRPAFRVQISSAPLPPASRVFSLDEA
jgi:predicted O-methyltransferase YrrM